MDKDQRLQTEIKQAFDRQTLGPDTRMALKAARTNALEREVRDSIPRWIPATAVSCLLLVIIGFLVNHSNDSNALPPMTAEELAVIASEDELELFEELEFYVWFDQDRDV